ncbi:MAG: hypothetical protein GXP58_05175 [Deltaproteobacteria bacterium]|nr:hypothetical protein [Deltaproteobacteria bacterium]
MAKEKKVIFMKDKIMEQINALKKVVDEKKSRTEDRSKDQGLRETHKKLKRFQRKLAKMIAMEKRAEGRIKKSSAAEKDKAEEGKEGAAEVSA